MNYPATMKGRLMHRRNKGNIRELVIGGDAIDFASNDYLGLARSRLLHEINLQEWTESGGGSTGSRLLTGNSEFVERLEQRIASYHGYEAGLIYGCGYMANVGLMSAVAGEDDAIIYDTHVHASVHDGIRLSGAYAYPFRHNNVKHLEYRLQALQRRGRVFVCIESVYSMDGTLAPLAEIVDVCGRYGAFLVVDEAHAVGVFGNGGRGLVAHGGLCDKAFAQVCTFGKALGSYGAIILGSSLLRECLINFSRPFIYTTALPRMILALISCGYDLLPQLEQERSHLSELIRLFRAHIQSGSFSPIQPVYCKGNQEAQKLSRYLASCGFDVRPIMSPTVRKGHECLRVCLHAYNTRQEVLKLISCIQERVNEKI